MFVRSIIQIRSIRLIDSDHYSCSADNGFTNDTSSSFEVVVEGKSAFDDYEFVKMCQYQKILSCSVQLQQRYWFLLGTQLHMFAGLYCSPA